MRKDPLTTKKKKEPNPNKRLVAVPTPLAPEARRWVIEVHCTNARLIVTGWIPVWSSAETTRAILRAGVRYDKWCAAIDARQAYASAATPNADTYAKAKRAIELGADGVRVTHAGKVVACYDPGQLIPAVAR